MTKTDLIDVQQKFPTHYRVIMSDIAGNDERLAFLYNSQKLIPSKRDWQNHISNLKQQDRQTARN